MKTSYLIASFLLLTCLLGSGTLKAQPTPNQDELDEKVRLFLEESQGKWRDLNVPYEDGKVLYDIIVKNNYRSALEIGTSTGHSTVWIAWALSKTGGKRISPKSWGIGANLFSLCQKKDGRNRVPETAFTRRHA